MLALWQSWNRPHPSNVRDEYLLQDEPDSQMLEFGNWSLRVWEGFSAQRYSNGVAGANLKFNQTDSSALPCAGCSACCSLGIEYATSVQLLGNRDSNTYESSCRLLASHSPILALRIGTHCLHWETFASQSEGIPRFVVLPNKILGKMVHSRP